MEPSGRPRLHSTFYGQGRPRLHSTFYGQEIVPILLEGAPRKAPLWVDRKLHVMPWSHQAVHGSAALSMVKTTTFQLSIVQLLARFPPGDYRLWQNHDKKVT